MFTKVKMLILVCVALMFTLCACAQSQVNGDRLTGSESSGNSDMSTSDEDTVDESDTILGKYVDADKVFEQDDFFGYGHVNFYVNDIKQADNMSDAGIDEAIYQLSGSPSYDYYITVSLTIENVDVSVDDESIDESFKTPLINSFRLHRQAKNDNDSRDYELAYFDLGGAANSDAKRYFQYQLPNPGETLDVVIGFGLKDYDLSDIKNNNDSLYLRNEFISGMMAIEGIL